ncbi:nuclear transport factor 2 family protein [Actinotalea sp. M2MS4P-6]|uniref:nuclear transport factor 2 family protein n=1 Tax=Actinotalea sp. M2MS4P-6 TaxID=2983762 RepID=UPI0021E441D4|nr:nuclear transport factor 2 family protein [Actinotalea sp. M2MS4P-6]MCV2395747.1 nuclear transport factor 2 family protein [Actinotalea sp. M2MS4P-6]
MEHSPHVLEPDVVDRLMAATNAHDLDALVACFAPDYVLTDPVHPSRGFTGNEQVRRNWAAILAGVPDLTCTVHARADAPAGSGTTTVWLEMSMTGTRRDGAPHELVGVMVFGVRDGAIASGRFFLEPVDHAAVDSDAAVRAAMGAQGR